MAFASGSGRRVAYVAETAFGVTPATPTFKTARITGGGPRTNKTTNTSDEIQADRNVRDEFLLGKDSAGAYNFELTYGTFDDILQAALFGAWTTNVLKNGITPQSLTIEETLELGVTDSFSRFTGCMVSSLSLAIAARAVVTGSFNIMAKQEALDTAIIAGATYTAPNTNPVSTASANVASLSVSGLTTQPKIKSVSLDMNNNLRTRPIVGDIYSQEFGSGRFELKGTLECYFENNELYQSVLDHGTAALSFTVGNAVGSKYTFLVPKLRFANGERRPGGNNDDVMVSVPFTGLYDTTTGCTLQITRAV